MERRRLASKPKFRMRTKPLGSRCNRNRRRNSSSDRVITDLGPEMSGIAGDLKKSVGTGPEEQTIDDLCSLIEFLESAVQGKSYRYRPKGAPSLGPYEYSSGSDIFVSFLINRAPFKNDFIEATARDFYEGVRCGLLHEARTKNGWTIWATHSGGQTIDANQKIIYRDNFQAGLLAFVEWYKGALPSDHPLQEAFIRKFDSLCVCMTL
jgi:hypothetical protein